MIAETRDPDILNHFAQHPEIIDGIGGPLDLTGAIRDTAVFLFGEHGGFLFEWCAPGTYEVHAMITEAGRGAWGFAAAKQARAMIEAKGCDHLWCRIKPRDRHIAALAIRTGFRDAGCFTFHGLGRRRVLNWRSPCPQQ